MSSVNLIFVLGLLSIGMTAQAQLACYYDGDEFIVFQGDAKYSYNADDNWSGECRSSNRLAAFYDGDEFIVFNANTSSFSYYSADDDIGLATVEVSGGLAAMYDGDEFIVYDQNKSEFTYYSADDEQFYSLAAGRGIAAMYDGDELIVYDQIKSEFVYYSSDDGFENFKLITGNGILLAYDGDELISYCGGNFSYKNADDGKIAHGRSTPWSRQLHMSVGDDHFFISKEDCILKEL